MGIPPAQNCVGEYTIGRESSRVHDGRRKILLACLMKPKRIAHMGPFVSSKFNFVSY